MSTSTQPERQTAREAEALDLTRNDVFDTLKQRDHWICWRWKWIADRGEYAKMPTCPRGSEYQNASSTDASTWGDFAEAWQFHLDHRDNDIPEDQRYGPTDGEGKRRDTTVTQGLGYVFSADDVIMGVDLDDCRDPDSGTIDEWALDVMEMLQNAYWEVSPSGTGLHALVVGMKPEGPNRADVGDSGGHIEVYDSGRYFTVTGQHVVGTPLDAMKAQVEVKTVYEAFLADNDAKSAAPISSEPSNLEDADLIEKAKSAKNGQDFQRLWNGDTSMHSDDHSRADMALCSMLAFWTGCDTQQMDRLFRASGLMREKWDAQRGDTTYGARTINEAIANCTEVYTPPSSKTSNRGSTSDSSPPTTTSTPVKANAGGYGYWKRDNDGDPYWDRVTNFLLQTQRVILQEGEKYFELKVIPSEQEAPFTVTVSPTVFNEPRDFKAEVAVGLTTVFDGNATDLGHIRIEVANQDAPTVRGRTEIGVYTTSSGPELVTPLGTLTTDGWTDSPENVFVDRGIDYFNQWELGPEQTDYDAEEVAHIITNLVQARPARTNIPVLGWFAAASVSPYVRKWESEFNPLQISGETGAGKSASTGLMARLWGWSGEPASVDAPPHGLLTVMSSSVSVPVWLDEYKPSEIQQYRLDAFYQYLRNSTRGGHINKGTAGLGSDSFRLSAPIIISGEESASHRSAEMRRTIPVRYQRSTTTRNPETISAFGELIGGPYEVGNKTKYGRGCEPLDFAYAWYTWVLSLDEAELEQAWRKAGETVKDLLSTAQLTVSDELTRQGIQTVHFGFSLLRHFAGHIGVSQNEFPTMEEQESALVVLAKTVSDGSRTNHLDEFLKLMTRAAEAGYLTPTEDFVIVHRGDSAKEQLAFKLDRCHDEVSRYLRDHGIVNSELLSNADDYASMLSERAEAAPAGYCAGTGIYSPPLGRAARVRSFRADEEVSGFRRDAFVNDDEKVHDVDITALSELPEAGWVSVITATVATVNDPRPTMEQSGVFGDSTGAVDFVIWTGPPDSDEFDLLTGECYKLTNVKVSEYQGAKQLELQHGVTTVQAIQAGVGTTEPAESMKKEPMDEESGKPFETVLLDILEEEAGVDGLSEGYLLAEMMKSTDLDEDGVRDLIRVARSKGRLIERPVDGESRFFVD